MRDNIIIKNLHKSFGEGNNRVEVLHDISLNIRASEMTFLTGPSGCGKTTLISIIAGILSFDSGFLSVLEIESAHLGHIFRQNNIGFIFQQFNLVSTLSLAENVAIPLLIQGLDYEIAIEKAIDILGKVGLGNKTNSLPKEASGGQQQRVAIARALVNDPKVLICDEPTAALDSQTGHLVLDLLKAVSQDQDRSVIIVTHDNRIYEFADRIIKMEDGRVLTG